MSYLQKAELLTHAVNFILVFRINVLTRFPPLRNNHCFEKLSNYFQPFFPGNVRPAGKYFTELTGFQASVYRLF